MEKRKQNEKTKKKINLAAKEKSKGMECHLKSIY